MYKDYFVSMQLQPAIDIFLDWFNPTLVQPVYLSYVGLSFNTSELCLNNSDNIYFCLFNAYFYNSEGVNRNLVFFNNTTVTHTSSTIATGSGFAFSQNSMHYFNKIRITTVGGLVTNAATVITFIGLRISK